MAEDLTDLHELQLQSFLRFSNLKRQQHLREILQCVDECASGRIISGEMYSSSEVLNMLDVLRQEMRAYATKELENAYHSCALLMKMQLAQAQSAGISISVDVTSSENEALLQQVKACEKAAMARPATDFAVKRAGAVGVLGGTGVRTVADSAVVQQRDKLRSEVEALRSRLESLQTAMDAATSSNEELQKQLAQMQKTVAGKELQLSEVQHALQQQAQAVSAAEQVAKMQQAQAAMEAEAMQQQMSEVLQLVQAKDGQVKAGEQALASRIQDSKQWQQMKQLMQQKSQEVVELRRKLAKYEPEQVVNADTAKDRA